MIKPRRVPAPGQWPVAGVSQLDQARTVARTLLMLLDEYAPGVARGYADHITGHGATWLTAQADTVGPDGWMSTEQVAARAHVQPRAVSQWSTRGIVRNNQRIYLTRYPQGYAELEVDEFLAVRESRRDA